MIYKIIMWISIISAALCGGGTLGYYLGHSFSVKWDEQSNVSIQTEYEDMIEQNREKLENEDSLAAYQDMNGFEMEGTLIEQEEAWNLVLVNKWNPLDEDFKVELSEVYEGHKVDSRIVEPLRNMIADAKKAGYYIYVLSSYRDMDKQISLYKAEVDKWISRGLKKEDAQEKAGTIVAVPGTSEHHLGLAVDLVSSEHIKLDQDAEKTKGYKWLVAHCHEYGFILRYPNGSTDITGIIYEPWHFRYVGIEAAKEIMEKEMTLEEYLSEIAKK